MRRFITHTLPWIVILIVIAFFIGLKQSSYRFTASVTPSVEKEVSKTKADPTSKDSASKTSSSTGSRKANTLSTKSADASKAKENPSKKQKVPARKPQQKPSDNPSKNSSKTEEKVEKKSETSASSVNQKEAAVLVEESVVAEEKSCLQEEKPLSEASENSLDESSKKLSDKPSDKPIDKPADEPSDKPIDKPKDKPADVPSDKPVDKPADKPLGEPADSSKDNDADKLQLFEGAGEKEDPNQPTKAPKPEQSSAEASTGSTSLGVKSSTQDGLAKDSSQAETTKKSDKLILLSMNPPVLGQPIVSRNDNTQDDSAAGWKWSLAAIAAPSESSETASDDTSSEKSSEAQPVTSEDAVDDHDEINQGEMPTMHGPAEESIIMIEEGDCDAIISENNKAASENSVSEMTTEETEGAKSESTETKAADSETTVSEAEEMNTEEKDAEPSSMKSGENSFEKQDATSGTKEMPSEETSPDDPSTEPSSEQEEADLSVKSLSPEMQKLRDSVRQTINIYSQPILNTRDNTAAQLLDVCEAFGCDAEVMHVDKKQKINAFANLCYNYPCAGYQPLKVSHGRIEPRLGYGFQEAPGQLLAVMALARVPEDYTFQFSDKITGTVADLVKREKETCRSGEDLSFKLIGIIRYTPSGETWKSGNGQTWTVERLLNEVLKQPTRLGSVAGTNRLLAISYAVDRRAKCGEPIDGPYAAAAKYIAEFQEYALSMINNDGTWHSRFFLSKGMSNSSQDRLQSTAHILRWLVFSLPEDRLQDPCVIRAIVQVQRTLGGNARNGLALASPQAIDSQLTAVHALVLYDHRLFKPYDVSSEEITTIATAKNEKETVK